MSFVTSLTTVPGTGFRLDSTSSSTLYFFASSTLRLFSTCAQGEAETALRVLKESAHYADVSVDTTCAKVSIVGAGMQSHSGVASKMFEAMSNNNINIKMISTSEIKISCIIDRDDADKAVSAIHEMLFD